MSCKKSKKTLGVHVSPSMKWEGQFDTMVEKIKDAIYKLRKVEIAAPIAYLYYNAYLMKNVYFRSGVMSLTEKQEITLKQIYGPVLLMKMNLSEKFSRSVLYSRKIVLGIGLMAPKTIIDVLLLKLYLGNQRLNQKVVKIIQINEDNARLSYGYSECILEMKQKYKPNKIMWSD